MFGLNQSLVPALHSSNFFSDEAHGNDDHPNARAGGDRQEIVNCSAAHLLHSSTTAREQNRRCASTPRTLKLTNSGIYRSRKEPNRTNYNVSESARAKKTSPPKPYRPMGSDKSMFTTHWASKSIGGESRKSDPVEHLRPVLQGDSFNIAGFLRQEISRRWGFPGKNPLMFLDSAPAAQAFQGPPRPMDGNRLQGLGDVIGWRSIVKRRKGSPPPLGRRRALRILVAKEGCHVLTGFAE